MFSITSPLAVCTALALLSNICAAIPFFICVRHRVWPRTCDFAAISILLYYALGMIAEVAQPFQIGELIPFFGHSDTSAFIALSFMALAPWVLRLGSVIATPRYSAPQAGAKLRLSSRARKSFYVTSIILSGAIAIQSLWGLLETDRIWALKADIVAAWGPYILWFYIPSACLMFFIATTDLHGKTDKSVCLVLVASSVCATVCLCERTLMLIPFLVVLFFARGMTITRLVFVPGTALALAAVMLPIFKPSFANDDKSYSDLMFALVHGDISRAGVLAHAIDRSDLVGTRTLAYPMAGYVYAAAFFLPRNLAPWKGHSTAQCFTAAMTDFEVEDTDWGYGVGLIEESVLNGGIASAVPILLCYGLLFGCLDRLKTPSVILPLRLATFWVAGYHITAMMQTFGTAVILAVLFSVITRERRSSGPTYSTKYT